MTPFLLMYPLSFILVFTNLGLTGVVALLVVALLVCAASRLPRLWRGLQASLQQLLDLIRPRKLWRMYNPWPKQRAKLSQAELTHTVVVCSITAAFSLLFGSGFDGNLSLKQTLVALGVVTVWLSVWWLCFGNKKKE